MKIQKKVKASIELEEMVAGPFDDVIVCIRQAIDLLGAAALEGRGDEAKVKDSIANLSVVLLDLKSN